MRILFVYTNINGFHKDVYAVGMASVLAFVKQKGHDAKVLILHHPDDYPKLLQTIKEYEPGIVGFTSVSSQFSFVRELSEMVKANYPTQMVVCGGIHPTIYPNCIADAPGLDAVFVGEAEHAFEDFIEFIEKGESWENCDNLAYVKNGMVVRNKLKPLVHDFESLPYPDKETYPYGETIKEMTYAPLFFARGCPFVCTYCSNHAIAKNYGGVQNITRYRSVESSLREIQEVVDKFKDQVRYIYFGDDIFGLNKKWRKEFLEAYAERFRIPFFCLIRPDVLDDSFAQLLKKAGCRRILFGVESGNDYIRNEVMRRNMNRERIIKSFETCRKHGIGTLAINIIGTPTETEDMIWDTIKFNRILKPEVTAVNIFYPYKGTELGDKCFTDNFVDLEKLENFSNERRESVLKFPSDHQKKLEYYYNNWERLVFPYSFSRRIFKPLKQTLYNKLHRTPIWSILRKLKRMIAR